MISFPTIEKQSIRSHYDWATPFYRLLWGRHIHHGLWDAAESPARAQLQLTETLARLAAIERGACVLDVGCGMGGSSIHLAKVLDCRVTGVTLSAVQRAWARLASVWHGVSGRTTFRRQDVEQAEFDDAAFDVVWSIECTEHLFDKPEFFRRVSRWLAPGGRVAICAWLAGDRDDDAAVRQVSAVCEGFLCPSLGTTDDYRAWIEAAGMTLEHAPDWTNRVVRTWEICRQRVERSGVRSVARMLDPKLVLFLDRFDAILQAYQSGAMKYGCFVARKIT